MKNDLLILRKLALQVAEIAALPIQQEKIRLWKKLNALQGERPMVIIDQVCWSELAGVKDDKGNTPLQLQCRDKECREYEDRFRKILYQWEHFPVDMVVEPFVDVVKAVHGAEAFGPAFGIPIQENNIGAAEHPEASSHHFINQFQTMDDVEKIKMPVVTHDASETKRRLDKAHQLFDGILTVREVGWDPYVGIWDVLAEWMGVTDIMMDLYDDPDKIHAICARMRDGYMSMLDQLEEQGLLCRPQSLIHCTGAFSDELPHNGYNENKPRCEDIWMFGLAQVFSSISPAMFEEFEVNYMKPICERFGLVYYGCCDPLDGKMEQVRKIPHVRKVSMSPWANKERGAEEIGRDYVFSNKPNPALLGNPSGLDKEQIQKDLTETRDLCRKYHCSLEFIQKDISTLNKEPQRLDKWAKIAMEIACK
jgi:hypothetical protein